MRDKRAETSPSPKNNNYVVENVVDLRRQYKYIILFAGLFGINRFYVMSPSRCVQIIVNLYSFVLLFFVFYSVTTDNYNDTTSYLVFKYTTIVEYALLLLSSMLLIHKINYDVGCKLCDVDHDLNIVNERWLTNTCVKTTKIGITLTLLYNVVELILMKIYLDDFMTISTMVLYVPLMAHECEQVLFCAVLRNILYRLRILTAHVEKVLGSTSDDEVLENQRGIGKLSRNAELDVTSIHRIYESLHGCCENFNSIMSFPLSLMIFSSGISTIFMLKSFISLTQSSDVNSNLIHSHNIMFTSYYLVRCVKNALLVFTPCIYAHVTNSQVKEIRSIVHNALKNRNRDFSERRRIKAFQKLTLESEFVYSLCGLIPINMRLPLSYISICTTYLVIIIQFSKFID